MDIEIIGIIIMAVLTGVIFLAQRIFKKCEEEWRRLENPHKAYLEKQEEIIEEITKETGQTREGILLLTGNSIYPYNDPQNQTKKLWDEKLKRIQLEMKKEYGVTCEKDLWDSETSKRIYGIFKVTLYVIAHGKGLGNPINEPKARITIL